jgi:polyisoprenoid-binding protein YceI
MTRRLALVWIAVASCSFAEVATWRIDPAHSLAHFSVRHLMVSNVRGSFGGISGTVEMDPKDLAKARVEAEVNVANVDTREPKRDADLRSPNFFDVEKYPKMTFRSKRVETAGGKLKVIGDLTMHGVTKEVSFDVDGPSPEMKTPMGTRVGASATAKVNRKEFGLNWNKLLEGGGAVVGDEVAITLDLELVRQPAKS